MTEATQNNEGQQQDWKATLAENLRTEKTFEKFKGVDDLAAGYMNLEKQFTLSNRPEAIFRPEAGAPKEDWDKYYTKIGRPAAPENYDITLPKELPAKVALSDDGLKSIRTKLHEIGVAASQAPEIANLILEGRKSVHDSYEAERTNARRSAEEKLRGEWGDTYDTRLDSAKRFASKFGGEFVAKFANDPDFIRFAAEIGKDYEQDGLIGNEGKAQSTEQELRAEAKTLMAQPGYRDVMHADHMKIQTRLQDIYGKIGTK